MTNRLREVYFGHCLNANTGHLHKGFNTKIAFAEKCLSRFAYFNAGGASNSGYSPDTATSKLLNRTIYHNLHQSKNHTKDRSKPLCGWVRHHILCHQHLSLYIQNAGGKRLEKAN